MAKPNDTSNPEVTESRLSAAYPRHRRITPMALFALRTPETPDSVPTP